MNASGAVRVEPPVIPRWGIALKKVMNDDYRIFQKVLEISNYNLLQIRICNLRQC